MSTLDRVFCTYCKTEYSATYRDGELMLYNPARGEHCADCPKCGNMAFSAMDNTPVPDQQPDDNALAVLVDLCRED